MKLNIHKMLMIAIIILGVFSISYTSYSASFKPIGNLPGGSFQSRANAISGDGSVTFDEVVFDTYLANNLELKKIEYKFVLKRIHVAQIAQVAKMIVRLKSPNLILSKMSGIQEEYLKYRSHTKGAAKRADEVALKEMKRQINKEVWEAERQKGKQISISQREHIKRMMEMIKEMMKIRSNSLDKTIILR